MRSRALVVLAVAALPAVAAAQDVPAPCAAALATGNATQEMLVNQRVVGDYLLTVRGARLTNNTLLEMEVLRDGTPAPADTPITLELVYTTRDPDTRVERRAPIDAPPVTACQGFFVAGPLQFDAVGDIEGDIRIGAGDGAGSTAVDIDVYPSRTPLPAWFTPVSLAVPVVALALLMALVLGRRLPLFRAPADLSQPVNNN